MTGACAARDAAAGFGYPTAMIKLLRLLFPAAAMSALVAAAPVPRSPYEVTMTSIDGAPLPLAQYRGRVLMVVNTASFCGFTPQFDGLQKLSDAYGARGFTLIGVPSGDFMGQEYDDNGKIKKFCQAKFGVKFPMAEKSHVTGAAAAPFYRWASATIGEAAVPKWNFHKILIGRDGRPVATFGSKTTPEDPALRAAIETALKAG